MNVIETGELAFEGGGRWSVRQRWKAFLSVSIPGVGITLPKLP
ncbi:hypothetical protein [Burkholderia sp. BCC0322]|nr:hypothetical protein [Burkholderia sp. BCC0322]